MRAVIAAAALTAAAAAGLYAQEKRSVWDGVYSEEQAARGKDEYEYNCGNCHIHDLSGDSIKDVPALAGPDFMAKWAGKSVKETTQVNARPTAVHCPISRIGRIIDTPSAANPASVAKTDAVHGRSLFASAKT